MKSIYKVSIFFVMCLIIIAVSISYLYFELNEKIEASEKTISNNINQISELNNRIDDLEKELEEKQAEEDKNELHENSINGVENLDETVFLVDAENYKVESNEVKITEEKAKEIAEKGFAESAKRITSEGAYDIQSQRIEVKNVYANNYFTRKYGESDEDYKDIERKCYVVSRENEMGNGIVVYIDVTTGLIIGGEAYGD